MATSRFFRVEFDDIAEVCWPMLIKSSVHHGGNLELNSYNKRADRRATKKKKSKVKQSKVRLHYSAL